MRVAAAFLEEEQRHAQLLKAQSDYALKPPPPPPSPGMGLTRSKNEDDSEEAPPRTASHPHTARPSHPSHPYTPVHARTHPYTPVHALPCMGPSQEFEEDIEEDVLDREALKRQAQSMLDKKVRPCRVASLPCCTLPRRLLTLLHPAASPPYPAALPYPVATPYLATPRYLTTPPYLATHPPFAAPLTLLPTLTLLHTLTRRSRRRSASPR